MKKLTGLGCATALLMAAAAAVAPVQADVLGYTGQPDGTPSSGQRANFKRGSKFTLPENGVLKSLCAYLDGNGGSTARSQLYTIVVYRDENGLPGGKVAESNVIEKLNASITGPNPSTLCDTTSNVPLAAGNYWIMLHTGGTAGLIRYYSGPGENWYGNPDTFAGGASDPFGSGGGAGTGTVSVWAEYLTSSQLAIAGRTTIGTTPSAGLRSDFKRGSPIDVTVTGEPASATVYLDGLGGNTGTQGLVYALYRDVNGAPGDLVISSATQTISAGRAPGWYTIGFPRFPHITIAPGRYWIMVHTGENTGIARYYADGAGNWFGNADVFGDGPSNPFGLGGTGNGRISAFLGVEPTN